MLNISIDMYIMFYMLEYMLKRKYRIGTLQHERYVTWVLRDSALTVYVYGGNP